MQDFKTVIPWILVVILAITLIFREATRPKASITELESTIESKVQTEESLVDSFCLERLNLVESRDSSISEINSMDILGLNDRLKENIRWYEETQSSPHNNSPGK